MNTTLELPEPLVNEIRQRAIQQGRDVTDVVADLLKAGSTAAATNLNNSQLVAKTLPRIKIRPVQPPADRPATAQEFCDWIKNVDSQLEVERYEKALGHQHVDRADG